MAVTNEELARILADLNAKHDVQALAIASMVNAVGKFMPATGASFMIILGQCIKARAKELGLTGKQLAAAIEAVHKANHTLALLNSEPTDAEVEFGVVVNGTPEF